MEKNTLVIPIRGMHCRSCELLIEDNLSEVAHVQKSSVDYKKGIAHISYGKQEPDMREVESAIRKAGYVVGKQEKKLWMSSDPQAYFDLGSALLLLVALYVVLKNLGFSGFHFSALAASAANPSNLSVVLIVGLTAGVSSCMALVGGLILAISARHSELHPGASAMQKFRPHLFFNLGRIGGYALLGGILGTIGSAFQFSSGVLGALTIIVALVMLALGLKLIGIFPFMESFALTLPKSVSSFFKLRSNAKEYSHKGAFASGALTFFLPCGFTQAMQLYAVSTGSFMAGAMIMGVFALGTAPGLLGVGAIASSARGVFAKRFFAVAGVIVIFLAFFNITNGYTLLGLGGANMGTAKQVVGKQAVNNPLAGQANVKLENGVQVVSMVEKSNGYSPSTFIIKKGVSVRWEIDAQDPYSCASSLVLSKMGIRKNLVAGKNVIEFTPNETGRLPFSCSMGMYTGSFTVMEDEGQPAGASVSSNSDTQEASSGVCPMMASDANGGTGGGCGGSGGGYKGVSSASAADYVSSSSAPAVDLRAQVIKAEYTNTNDVDPNNFTVKSGQAVRFLLDVRQDGSGCMGTIMIPGLYDKVETLTKDKTIEMDFTPTKKGVYNITCAMGVPRGTITVE